MSDPTDMRVAVTWGQDVHDNARLRAMLRTFGMAEVSADEVSSLFAREPRERDRTPPRTFDDRYSPSRSYPRIPAPPAPPPQPAPTRIPGPGIIGGGG